MAHLLRSDDRIELICDADVAIHGTLVVTDCNEHGLTKVALFDLAHPSPQLGQADL